MNVAFKTLGCKLNQAETAILSEAFRKRGFNIVRWAQDADVAVLNTCTVTSRTDAKCRQAIRQARSANPEAVIAVVGCYSQISAQDIALIPGVDYIVGDSSKLALPDLIEPVKKRKQPLILVSDSWPEGPLPTPHSGDFGSRTRAFLRIQTGCDRRCAYCIVPAARGPSRCLPEGEILKHFSRLVFRGFREIVLTGVHVGDFRFQEGNSAGLSELLGYLSGLHPDIRIRMTSLDPENIDERLIRVMKENPNICRHFHVALQSGSDSLLKAMNRSHSASSFRKIMDRITGAFGPVGLGSDIITGFPGENDRQFRETVDCVQSIPFTYLHVFPFSARPGTAAAAMDGQVPMPVRLERADLLRELGQAKKENFLKTRIGRHAEVLFERRATGKWMSGLSSEYFRVEAPWDAAAINRFAVVQIEAVQGAVCRGTVLTLKPAASPFPADCRGESGRI
ncbi:tRNA (N(6)-L-threonylcarbamoyladenosine(37)-C(2))-methylthiotransferase MtaB [bacterium]|nr:tRNA (N(6)-L-threonylcarbamoyladenosine(37)-C(2))-methylthiotransferase MtaB [bacterium]